MSSSSDKANAASGDAVRDPARIARAYRRMLGVLTDRFDIERIAETAARLAADLLRADGASVTRVRDGHVEYIAGVGAATVLVGRRIGLDDSFTGRVVTKAEALVFDPRLAPVSSAERARDDRIRSGVVCPVLLEGRVVGTIGAISSAVAAFDDEAVERLGELAHFVAFGLERMINHHRIEQASHHRRLAALADAVVDRIEEPLTALTDAVVRARDTIDGGHEDGVVEEMLTEIRALGRVTDTLRDLRDTARASDDQPRGVELGGVFERVVEVVGPRIEKHAAFEVDVPDEPLELLAPPGRLWQVLVELLANARDAIRDRPRGLHRITLRCRAHAFMVELAVEDTGAGMDRRTAALIFEPYFTTRDGRDGLGLTHVWHAIHGLGGTIDVESRAREGTIVTIRLPRIASESLENT